MSTIDIDSITTNNLTTPSANISICTATTTFATVASSNHGTFTDTITFGNHKFRAEELGQLLTILLAEHPELKI